MAPIKDNSTPSKFLTQAFKAILYYFGRLEFKKLIMLLRCSYKIGTLQNCSAYRIVSIIIIFFIVIVTAII